jgi:tetratricopeptide (TPR) repeat protein
MTRDERIGLRKLIADAELHYRSGRLSEAGSVYRAALAVSPGNGIVTHNLGVVLAAQGDHRSAIACFDEALATDPNYVSAHYNRAVASMALGRTQDALQGFGRACALEPEHYGAHRALGFLWLSEGKRDRALDHFARTYVLRRGEDRTGIGAASLNQTTRHKLMHDAAQFRYVARLVRDGRRFDALARNYEQVAKDVSDNAAALSADQIAVLGEDYNTAIHVRDAPELVGHAVSPRPDRDTLAAQFNSEGAVYFDELLTPAALLWLKRYLLESTIWHDFSHIGGFVASYLEDGLACPLLLQVADELRATFPDLLGVHPLTQAWAFKGLGTTAAIDVHADDAAVSVNFWMTPNEANLSPGRGGLTVCRVPPPAGWAMQDYEADQSRIVTFLEQNAGNSLQVPYRENRAVLFRSRLFHHSDHPEFATGYENSRINITLLYGGAGS